LFDTVHRLIDHRTVNGNDATCFITTGDATICVDRSGVPVYFRGVDEETQEIEAVSTSRLIALSSPSELGLHRGENAVAMGDLQLPDHLDLNGGAASGG
jgi:hypothetical protein